jgi:hypothetical protein
VQYRHSEKADPETHPTADPETGNEQKAQAEKGSNDPISRPG